MVDERLADGPDDLQVVVAVELGVDAALQADLGGPHGLGLGHPVGDVAELEQVRRTPQVERQRPLGEGAELALEGADVGVVDVPVGHVGDLVAHDVVAELVGHLGHGPHLGAAGAEQGDDLVLVDRLSGQHRVEHLGDRTADGGQGDHLGSGGGGRHRQRGKEFRRRELAARRPRVVATETFGVGCVEHRESEGRIEPGGRLEGELGVDGEPGGQHMTGGLGGGPQDPECRPGPLRVDVVGGDRGHASPVVDAGLDQRAELVGQVGRRLQVDVGRQDQAGRGDGPQEFVARAGRVAVHRRPGLGQEVLDDHLLDVAVAGVAGRDGLERVDPVLAGLADPHQQAGGERDGQLAGCIQGGQSAGRHLVGGRAVGVEVGVGRLDHHPLAGRHGPQGGEVLGRAGPRRWRGGAARSPRAPRHRLPPGSRRSTCSRGRTASRRPPGSGPRDPRPG